MTAKYNMFFVKTWHFVVYTNLWLFTYTSVKLIMFVLVLDHLMDYIAMICVLILNVKVYKVSSINLVVNQISKEWQIKWEIKL